MDSHANIETLDKPYKREDSYKTQNFITSIIRRVPGQYGRRIVRRLSRRSSLAGGCLVANGGLVVDINVTILRHVAPLSTRHTLVVSASSLWARSRRMWVTKRSSCALFSSSSSSFNRGCFSTVCIGASDKFPTSTREWNYVAGAFACARISLKWNSVTVNLWCWTQLNNWCRTYQR
jgi:hypothetical protein